MTDAIIRLINESSWADYSIGRITIDFEEIRIEIHAENAESIQIYCRQYIGYSLVGHWDESVIQDINIDIGGNLVEESLRAIKKTNGLNPLPGGGVKMLDNRWYQLSIRLIDGATIRFAFMDIGMIRG